MALRHAARQAAALWRLPALAAAGPSTSCSSNVLLPAALRGLASSAAAGAAATETYPVVVAGGGPVGLTTALLLSRYGVPCLLLERDAQLTEHPRAHLINHRTMEVFRGLDGLAAAVQARMPPLEQWRRFVYCNSMAGDIVGVVDHFPGQTTPLQPAISPEPVAHLAQHKLLPLMASRAAAAPGVTLRMGHRVTRVVEGADGMRVEVEGPAEGPTGSRRYHVDCQYLVAADGVRGTLRHQLGVGMAGPGAIQHLINIHFISPQLGRLLRGREGMLYFVFSSDVIAVMVAHNIDEGEFVAQVPYFPPLQSPSDFTPDVCTDLIRKAAGRSDLQLQTKTVRPWTMAGKVANTYKVGRALLVGDSAHMFPPSGAFGMNTGIAEAHNLAWKLAAVLGGQAGPALLGSYTQERQPVAVANMQLSVDNFYEALRIPALMGLDFKTANMLSDALGSSALRFLPSGLRKAALESTFKVGRAASAPMRVWFAPQLRQIFDSGETLRLQYPKEDLGFIYSSPAAALQLEEGDGEEVAEYIRPKPREAPYTPTTLPGARLPHRYMKLLRQGSLRFDHLPGQAPSSTIDLAAAAGAGSLLLLLAAGSKLGAWLEAAQRVQEATGVLIHPVVRLVGLSSEVLPPEGSAATVVEEQAWEGGNAAGGWYWAHDLGPESALLVRPDGHIAWRQRRLPAGSGSTGLPGQSEAGMAARALEGAVRRVFCQ